jgi:hypothetical protein
MAWRSSLVASVLLALVALHSSALVGLASPETTAAADGQEQSTDPTFRMARALGVQEGSTDLDARIKAELFEQATKRGNIKAGIDLINLFSLIQPNKAHCSNERFIEKAQNLIHRPAFDRHIQEIITTQATLCADELAKQFQRGLESLSKSTREHFESFVKQGNGPFYPGRFQLIAEVRRIIGSPKGTEDNQSTIRRGYLHACKEATDEYGDLMRTLKIYKPYAFGVEAYVPLSRFSTFCQTLIKLDLSKELDQAFTNLIEDFAITFEHLRAERTSIANSDAQQERSAAKASIQAAERANPNSVVSELSKLKWTCSYAIKLADNILWMLKIKDDGKLEPSVEQKLRYLKACEQLEKLGEDEIFQKAYEETNEPNKSNEVDLNGLASGQRKRDKFIMRLVKRITSRSGGYPISNRSRWT